MELIPVAGEVGESGSVGGTKVVGVSVVVGVVTMDVGGGAETSGVVCRAVGE